MPVQAFDIKKFRRWLVRNSKMIKRENNNFFINLEIDDLEKFIRKLVDNWRNFRVVALNGYFVEDEESGKKSREFILMYHLSNESVTLTIKIELPEKPKLIESITNICPEAEVFEREFSEMFGIRVVTREGTHKKLLLEDVVAPFDEKDKQHIDKQHPLEPQGYCLIPLGPQHPALIEPENFILRVEDERVIDAQINIGYIHRGIEKLAETRNYIQNIYLIERVCGICSAVHTVTYTKCVESIADIDVPRRAEFIRTIILELERIHSHMLWLGIFAYEMGQDTLFQYIFRDREKVLDRLEEISGNRINYGMSTIGGARRDITKSAASNLLKTTSFIKEKAREYYDTFSGDKAILSRTERVGKIRKSIAERYATGPNLRACGVRVDMRKLGYCAYDEISFTPVINRGCDANAVALVRIREIEESCRIIEECVKKMPPGPIKDRSRAFLRIGGEEGVFRTEAPRGELFYYLRGNNTDRPYRIKIRTPTFANIQLLPYMLKNQHLADVPIVLASIDPCFSCCERITLIDINENSKHEIKMDDLRRMRHD